MIYLCASIFCSTFLVFIFKLFPRFGVNLFEAIIINYFICVLTAFAVLGDFPIDRSSISESWSIYSLSLAVLFITGFNFIGITVQKFGITLATIMQKMSLVITVIFAIIVYHEVCNLYKIIGILLAIAAIIFTNIKPSAPNKKTKNNTLIVLPALVLITSAVIEIIIQYVESTLLTTSGDPRFIALAFGTAGLLGLIYWIIRKWGNWKGFGRNEIIGGIVLGVPNYLSIYFMMKTLGTGWEGSTFFPINNVAIITLSALFAYLLFKEKLTPLNIFGVALGILSILLIAMA